MPGTAEQLQDTLQSIAEPVCRAHGVELVDVRYVRQKGGAVVRVIIDRQRVDGEEGSDVSIDDCTSVSRDLSSALDVHDGIIPGQYNLEVSSPGLERPLVKRDDFNRFAGREVQIKTSTRVNERKRFKGRLLGLEGKAVRIEEKGETFDIPYDMISKANLVYRL